MGASTSSTSPSARSASHPPPSGLMRSVTARDPGALRASAAPIGTAASPRQSVPTDAVGVLGVASAGFSAVVAAPSPELVLVPVPLSSEVKHRAQEAVARTKARVETRTRTRPFYHR